MRRDERKSVLEDVDRLERENASLRDRIAEERARAQEALEATVQTRPRPKMNPKASTMKLAVAISLGLSFGLVTLAFTMLLMPPTPRGHDARDLRGASAGVCR